MDCLNPAHARSETPRRRQSFGTNTSESESRGQLRVPVLENWCWSVIPWRASEDEMISSEAAFLREEVVA